MKKAARFDKRTVWDELSIVLMDNTEIARVNLQSLGMSHPTDVLSFRYQSINSDPYRASGEIILNVECALVEGERRGCISTELALYLAHGCDHLVGEKDDIIKRRKRMRARELRWLKDIRGKLDLSQLLRNNRA